MKRASALVLGALLLLGSATIGVAQEQTDPSVIGKATMAPDGTIKLDLLGDEESNYAIAHMEYKKTNPDYPAILAHLGGIKPGETKPVTAWPPEQNAH